MDPFTAIGLASSIVQFVDFSAKLIAEGLELYHTGTSASNVDLEEIATDIKQLNEKLIPPNQSDKGLRPPSKDEEALRKLAGSCRKVADQLLFVLNDRRVRPHRKWQSFRKALTIVWNKNEIRDLEKRLKKYREQISQRLIIMMSDQQSSILMTLNSLANKDLNQLKVEVLAAIEQSKQASSVEPSFSSLPTKLYDLADAGKTATKEERLLSSLRFKDRRTRQLEVKDAHPKTFEWIFEDSQRRPRPQIEYKQWLESGDNVYWIAGKPGSGKSTLMKHITNDPRTNMHLKKWVGKEKLVTASFFFWNAGTVLQKSQQGLLQSLMHEILGQCSQLMPILFPSRWQIHDTYGTEPEPWARNELLEAFDLLTKQTLLSAKFCFFVDGLDEYDGDPDEIINTFKSLAMLPNIKLCLSSRLWNEFKEAFGKDSSRTIMLQDFTRDDIRLYLQKTLNEDNRYEQLEREDPRCKDLITEIVDLAQGVFLWVTLVVKSLLRGLTNADDVSDLQEKLRRLPPDLEAYFQHMFDGIDEFYREQTALIFGVVVEAIRPLSIVAISFVEKENKNPQYSLKAEIRPYGDDEVNSIHRKVQKRLNARCKDLLEINIDPDADFYFRYKVDFLHRTVRDFLKAPHMRKMLSDWTTETFNAQSTLCKALLGEIKSLPMKEEYLSTQTDLFELVDDFLYYAHVMESEHGLCDETLLDTFDSVVSFRTGAAKIHWTNLEISGRLRDDDEQKSFVALAIENSLPLYVTLKLDSHPTIIRQKRGRPLLSYALPHPYLGYALPPNLDGVQPDMVRLLLMRGSQPNDKAQGSFRGITVWAIFLLEIQEFKRLDPNYFAACDDLYQLTEMLIESGADPDLLLQGAGTVSNILKNVFSPKESAHLEYLLAQNRRSRLWKWLGWSQAIVTLPQRFRGSG